MKKSNLLRRLSFAALAMIMTAGIYSCKSKDADATETDMDTIRTVEEVETMPADTTANANDTTAPAP